MEYRWIEWNLEHIGRHGVGPEEVEWVVDRYPARDAGNDKYKVWGQSEAGRYLQAVFVLDPDGRVFVIHARELTDREKRGHRRRSK